MTMYSRLSDIELNLFPWNLIKYPVRYRKGHPQRMALKLGYDICT